MDNQNFNNYKLLRRVAASAEATFVTALFVAVITIVGEEWSPLKDTLKAIFTHHWLGKSILSVVLFVFIFVLRMRQRADIQSVTFRLWLAAAGCSIAAAALLIFFTLHTLKLI